MIDLLIRLICFESIDKQLLRTLLHRVTFSLFILITLSHFDLDELIYANIMLLLVFSFLLFILLNTYFNYVINKSIRESLNYADFKKFVSKFSEIWKNKASIYSDLREAKDALIKLFIPATLAGFSFFLFIFSIVSIAFRYLEIEREIWAAVFFILLFLSYRDLLKIDFLQMKTDSDIDHEKFIGNVLEKYMITNSLEQMPHVTTLTYVLYFLVNLLSPIVSIRAPDWYVDIRIYYTDSELVDTIYSLVENVEGQQMTKEERKGLFLREEKEKTVFSVSQLLLLKYDHGVTHISKILNKTPKENWPYLFDPEYSPEREKKSGEKSKDNQRKYTILQIISKDNKKENVVGYMFINLYKGVDIAGYKPIQNKSRNKATEDKKKKIVPINVKKDLIALYEPKNILYIIFVGEETYIKAIEMMLDVNGRKVPKETLPIEIIVKDEN